MAPAFTDIASIPVRRREAQVHEHGWQSWSPTRTYAVAERPHRPAGDTMRVLAWRPEQEPPADAFQGEGLLAIEPARGAPLEVFAARDGRRAVPSVRARLHEGQVIVSTDDPEAVLHTVDAGAGGIDAALARWAAAYVDVHAIAAPRRAPTTWCSWYRYFGHVTAADVLENATAMDDLDVPVDVVQLDDGYATGVGDWLSPVRERVPSLRDLAARVRDRGRRAGIWIAPFLVGARSRLAADHPDWLVGADTDAGPAWAGVNWHQSLHALDVTHPDAAAWLSEVLASLRAWGFDFVKADFLYAGALAGRRRDDVDGLAAYVSGMRLLRDGLGPQTYLLGCGAPILPSIGLVDAMRVSPDIAHEYAAPEGDLTRPSQVAATTTGAARAFQQGRFWVNDPDCLIVRPGTERRVQWAHHVERYGGLRSSGDRLRELDRWGLETTRRLLRDAPPPVPFVPA